MTDETNFKNWMNTELNDFYHANTYQNMNFTEFKRECCFFVTMTFDQAQIRNLRQQLTMPMGSYKIEMDSFNTLYHDLCEVLYGKRYLQKTHRLPWAAVGIDYSGSRYAKYRPIGLKNIHVHALFAIPPADRHAFKTLLRGPKWRGIINRLYADRVLFEPYDLGKGKDGHSTSYVAKAFIKARDDGPSADGLRIYPGPDPKRTLKSYAADIKYPTVNRSLERMIRIARVQRMGLLGWAKFETRD